MHPVFERMLIATLSLSGMSLATAADWPQFRGPGGQGHSQAQNLPLAWSETENVTWKIPVAGLGWSSPSIQGNQIWLTTAIDDGKSLRAIAFDTQTGKSLYDVEVFHLDDPGAVHSKNSHASPTPIIEGESVYVHFGAHGTACVATDGTIKWAQSRTSIQSPSRPRWIAGDL